MPWAATGGSDVPVSHGLLINYQATHRATRTVESGVELCAPWGRSLSPAACAEPENPPGQGVRGASNKHSSQVVETNHGQSGRPPVTPKLLKASSYHLGRLMEKGLSLLSVLMAGFCFLFLFLLGNQKACPPVPDPESGVSVPPNPVTRRSLMKALLCPCHCV